MNCDRENSQNPLMDVREFINYCKKCGVKTNEEEIEFFEQQKILSPLEIEPINRRCSKKYYSSFQLYWVDRIKNHCCVNISLYDFQRGITSNGAFFERTFDRGKEELKKQEENFKLFLKFAILVQDVYFPYVRSGSKTFQVIGNDKLWEERRRKFNLKVELDKVGIKIKEVAKWYCLLAGESRRILGINRDDWSQLWKNINWDKKKELSGSIRLGIEYLQWAVMLKRVIENYTQKEIFDIDETDGFPDDILLELEPEKVNSGFLLRSIRNQRYSNEGKNYYDDRYKRIFYLANDFGIDYQPRLMVFVEGVTEERIFPIVFKWYTGDYPENFGIEFMTIEGIDKLFGAKIKYKNSGNKYENTRINNFNNLVSYNLNKWQILPFFIGDNECGDPKDTINNLLDSGNSISFNGEAHSFPKKWRYIWGINNVNSPFRGKDFELSNFTNEEIACVLSETLKKTVPNSDIESIRTHDEGIKQFDINVESYKVEIANKLCQNLFAEYEMKKNDEVFKRPIFKVINVILEMAGLNHPPTDTKSETRNKKYIEKELRG
jgi:hypothetical protein